MQNKRRFPYTPNPIRKGRSENTLENLTYEAEALKEKAYENYYWGKTLQQKTAGLLDVLRCHYIKLNCGCRVHSGVDIRYNEFKKIWLDDNKFIFDSEVLNGL